MTDLLQIAGLARSTFYYHCQATQRAERQSAMAVRIRGIYDEHKGRYGYRRITAALCSSTAERHYPEPADLLQMIQDVDRMPRDFLDQHWLAPEVSTSLDLPAPGSST